MYVPTDEPLQDVAEVSMNFRHADDYSVKKKSGHPVKTSSSGHPAKKNTQRKGQAPIAGSFVASAYGGGRNGGSVAKANAGYIEDPIALGINPIYQRYEDNNVYIYNTYTRTICGGMLCGIRTCYAAEINAKKCIENINDVTIEIK